MKIRVGTKNDFIKAFRRGSREAEIELYGHPIQHKRTHRNKKTYNRKIKHKLNDSNQYF